MIFVGDVQSLALLETFHASAQLARAEDAATAADLKRRLRERLAVENELVVDPAFFLAVGARHPRLGRATFRARRGRFWNETTQFHYDVTLHAADAPAPPAARPDAPVGRGRRVLPRARVGARRRRGAGARHRNPQRPRRPRREGRARCSPRRRIPPPRRRLKEAIAQDSEGVDPEDVYALAGPARGIEVLWPASGDGTTFDVLALPAGHDPRLPLPVAGLGGTRDRRARASRKHAPALGYATSRRSSGATSRDSCPSTWFRSRSSPSTRFPARRTGSSTGEPFRPPIRRHPATGRFVAPAGRGGDGARKDLRRGPAGSRR